LNVLKTDDPAIKDVQVYNTNEIRLARSFNIRDLIRHDFKLKINDINYLVTSTIGTKFDVVKKPQFNQIHLFLDQKTHDHTSIPYSDYLNKALELGLTEEEAKKAIIVLAKEGKVLYFEDNLDLKETIFLRLKDLASVAESKLNVDYLRSNIQEKLFLLEQYRSELRIMLSHHKHLHERAQRTVKIVSWSIFAFLTGQAILFARLVWWDFDWGVMEPVTWFTSICEMTIGGYIYYLITKMEYGNTLTARMLSEKRFKKLCEAHKLDLEKIASTENWIRQIETDVDDAKVRLVV